MKNLTPDLGEAQQFLNALEANSVFTFQTLDDLVMADGKKRGDPRLNKVFHGTLEEHADKLIQLNRKQAGVFVMVNEGDGIAHAGYKTCRSAASVLRVRALFVDLDGPPIAPVMNAALKPDITVESSPERHHAYWLAPGFPLGEFSMRQKQLIAKFKGDPSVHDLCRVMRLPGFVHQKGNPFRTRIIGIGK
jgi:hypothetical protein